MDQIGWLRYLATERNSPESWHYRRSFWSSETLFSLFEGIIPRFTHLWCNFFNKPDEINREEPVVQVNHHVQSMKSILLLTAKLSKIWVYRQYDRILRTMSRLVPSFPATGFLVRISRSSAFWTHPDQLREILLFHPFIQSQECLKSWPEELLSLCATSEGGTPEFHTVELLISFQLLRF